jgi:hypothetical protein
VVTGYIERLQRPENLIHFFHDIVAIDRIEPAVLEQRTTAYRAWVRQITDEHRIPVLACPLTSMEQGRTFVSYTRGTRAVLQASRKAAHPNVDLKVESLPTGFIAVNALSRMPRNSRLAMNSAKKSATSHVVGSRSRH